MIRVTAKYHNVVQTGESRYLSRQSDKGEKTKTEMAKMPGQALRNLLFHMKHEDIAVFPDSMLNDSH
jgi:hypothetical protein